MFTLLVVIISLALLFDVINGFHDAANSIATIVSTKVLSPTAAVVWAAFFNYIALHLLPLHVAEQVGKGIVDPHAVTLTVLLSGLIAAIVWDLITWWYGIPTSSSHTLIGGFVGASIARSGFGVIITSEIIRITLFIVLAPLIGMIFALIITIIITQLGRKSSPRHMDKLFKRLQLVSSAVMSIGHGTSDAQKSMGIAYVALISAGMISVHDPIPGWVVYAFQIAMALGTLLGGWRIVKTMGQRITKLHPFEGFSAETAGGLTLIFVALAGIPVSTTHTIAGSIMGVGAAKRLSAVRWGVSLNMVWAWIITIPITAILAALLYALLHLFIHA
ncbi:inorganic phosphate transporter [Thermoflavifilum thermophilum]|uniref:Inorganic phosphate transporter, PiT family n=1 Tax=Thermoflavifilum thermophilum TaxID=1393122 RepID=A0A1I7ND82_9BACT|nr:inorganic phosphate transporter [Thermoflavifilum thermophilum]SFV32645.1 inorganic phosphate transporter, PiT family [Thermoflavifilum thermophilum]